MRFFFLVAALVVAACGSDSDSDFADRSLSDPSSSGGAASASPDAGTAGGSSGAPAAYPDAAGALPNTCEGACREMSLVLTKGDASIAFDRAQFGFVRGSSVPKLQLAMYAGGDSACPSPESKQSVALQVQGFPVPLDNGSFASSAGLTGSLFDFQGDFITGTTVLKATHIDVTPVAASLDPRSANDFLAFDVRIEFEQGIVAEGHAFARHCPSIDQR